MSASTVDNADWFDENTRIVCELFLEQVRGGNRSGTHLNNVGYANVITKFEEKTGLQYQKLQFKNKWAKLKLDYNLWKKLIARETGLGWDQGRGTIVASDDWWAKAKKALPGCMKFKLRGLQNEDLLQHIFEDLRNIGNDHWNPARGNIPESSTQPTSTINVDDIQDVNDGDDNDSADEDFSPPAKRGKKAVGKDVKKPKTSGGQWFYEQMTRFVDNQEKSAASVESLVRREDTSGCSIKDVMTLVKECGATFGTKEHFIASEIFTKKSEREMFMTLDSPKERFAWLTMKHEAKASKNHK